jgi:hypothetical protein
MGFELSSVSGHSVRMLTIMGRESSTGMVSFVVSGKSDCTAHASAVQHYQTSHS